MTDPTTTSCQAWAIKAPDGSILFDTIRQFDYQTWHVFVRNSNEKSMAILEEHGFRCVRVRIIEEVAE